MQSAINFTQSKVILIPNNDKLSVQIHSSIILTSLDGTFIPYFRNRTVKKHSSINFFTPKILFPPYLNKLSLQMHISVIFTSLDGTRIPYLNNRSVSKHNSINFINPKGKIMRDLNNSKENHGKYFPLVNQKPIIKI